jgi:imidazolonepropionase-like amidohydrolase
MKNWMLVGLCFLSAFSFCQLPVPQNGVHPSSPAIVALKNARIVQNGEKTIENGTLVIENGRITQVGSLVTLPKGAVVMDMKGKTIVPAFIEGYSDIGLPDIKQTEWSPRPQIESSKEGAYYWNESIQPEMEAAAHFKVDAKASKKLQEMGYAVAVTHLQNGVMRGTGAAVALGDVSNRRALIKDNAGMFFSFKKGNSRQTYPSSQMGSIALFRQAVLDAQWYKNHGNSSVNLSLEAINKGLAGHLVFEVDDKLEVLRAQKLGKEFGLTFTMIGKGDEYEEMRNISPETRLIIPLNFPEPYEVKDPFVSRQIPLSDLKKWELAPSNAYFLEKNGFDFAITTRGIKKADDFWKNLHLAMERGLSRKQAIKALTENPARFFGLHDFGTLEEGKVASFSVFDKDPFQFKSPVILESWSLGKQHILKTEVEIDIRGRYNLNLDGDVYVLKLSGKKDKPTGHIEFYTKKKDSVTAQEVKDTLKSAATVTIDGHDVHIHFNLSRPGLTGAYTLHGKYTEKLAVFEGQGQLPSGKWVRWSGIRNEKADKSKDKHEEIAVDSLPEQMIWYPNMAYGFQDMPEKKVYVLRNATLWTNEEAGIIKDGSVIIKDGKIDFVGKGTYSIPAGAVEINAAGMHITSGIIDEHSHIAISKGVNEGGQSNSAEVRIGDVVRNNDINIYRQLSGGVTSSQLLHGSANAIGGQSALIKLKWGYSPDDMLISNQPKFIKFALGENVKQTNWGDFQTERFPQTRMGVEQVFYDAFIRAKEYEKRWKEYEAMSPKQREKANICPPARDLELESVLEIVNGERFISCHSYVQSEINMLMTVADSIGFTVNTFTHILEGYKLADKMAKHGAAGSTFSDWWAYKYEVNDAVPHNASLMHEQGVLVGINSDDAEMGRRLNQEAAKVIKYGGASEEDAWKMVTLNPAKMLHLDDRMGSLKVGKDADIVIWSDNPLTMNAKALRVFIDGELLYDYQHDERMRQANREERARIISKMLDDNQKGNPAKTFVKQKEKHWHCDTIGEHAEEHHSH